MATNIITTTQYQMITIMEQDQNSNSLNKISTLYTMTIDQQSQVEKQHTILKLDTKKTAGACDIRSDKYTTLPTPTAYHDRNLTFAKIIVIIQNSCDESDPCILFSYCTTLIEHGQCVLSSINKDIFDENQIEDIYYGKIIQLFEVERSMVFTRSNCI